MKFHFRQTFIVTASLILSVGHAESREAHTHGLANVTVAVENNALHIQLESPAANIVGFEHKARSLEERAAVNQAKKILEDWRQLFTVMNADCAVEDSEIAMAGLESQDASVHEHSMHEENSHDEHHHDSHDHGEHHSKEDNTHHEHANSHSEILANYQFTCTNVDNLSFSFAGLFGKFPAIEKLEAQWITKAKQGAKILSKDQDFLILK